MLPPFVGGTSRNAPEVVRREINIHIESSLRSKKRSARPVADPCLPVSRKRVIVQQGANTPSKRVGVRGSGMSAVALQHGTWLVAATAPLARRGARTTHLSLAACLPRYPGDIGLLFLIDRGRLTSRVTHASEESWPNTSASLVNGRVCRTPPHHHHDRRRAGRQAD